jgi:hypothetical protein
VPKVSSLVCCVSDDDGVRAGGVEDAAGYKQPSDPQMNRRTFREEERRKKKGRLRSEAIGHNIGLDSDRDDMGNPSFAIE